MKSTGMVRRIDPLGRVVLPIELRRTLELAEKDPVEIFVEDDRIILKKYLFENACAVTGDISEHNISVLDGKLILSPEGVNTLLVELEKKIKGERTDGLPKSTKRN